jgi:hypothetical protein
MLPKTVVGFSDSDIEYYWRMLAWKGTEGIDFHFADGGLDRETNREDEDSVKAKARERIGATGKYALLIGEDTWYRPSYVGWEAAVAIEQGCTIIGINLDGARQIVETKCPAAIRDIGAIFVPFSPRIVAYALVNYRRRGQGNWHFPEEVYRQLEFTI